MPSQGARARSAPMPIRRAPMAGHETPPQDTSSTVTRSGRPARRRASAGSLYSAARKLSRGTRCGAYRGASHGVPPLTARVGVSRIIWPRQSSASISDMPATTGRVVSHDGPDALEIQGLRLIAGVPAGEGRAREEEQDGDGDPAHVRVRGQRLLADEARRPRASHAPSDGAGEPAGRNRISTGSPGL